MSIHVLGNDIGHTTEQSQREEMQAAFMADLSEGRWRPIIRVRTLVSGLHLPVVKKWQAIGKWIVKPGA